mgnify:CR=1 FL=1
MDEEQSNPYDSGSGLTATGMPPDKKKILIIGVVTLFVIVVVVVSIFLSSGSQKPGLSRSDSGSSNPVPTGSLGNLSPTISQGTSQSPAIVAKTFYDWYVNHPSPIKSGAYKAREDVISDFKEVMGSFISSGIDPGYDHVFCATSKLPKNVTLAEPIYSDYRSMALIMFRDTSGTNLFQMKLEVVRSKWLVSDAWCPPVQ